MASLTTQCGGNLFLEIARQRGIPVRVIVSAGKEREAYDRLLIDELMTHEVDLVCLAGFTGGHFQERTVRHHQPALFGGVNHFHMIDPAR